MRRIYIFFSFLIVSIVTTILLTMMAPQGKQEANNDLRILELLPNLAYPLAVDPGIPTDFVARSPNGSLNPYDLIYWGPKDVLKAYFKDPASLKVPLIRLKLSEMVVQTSPNSFPKKLLEYFKKLEQEDPKAFAFIETEWGDYPVIAIRNILKSDGRLNFMAWVGLNDPETGWTLAFELVYPDEKGRPNKNDRELWANLLTKTTQLKDGDYFRACGQDLQEGYTLVNVGHTKLKMFAEKRQSDGTLQVVVIPQSTDVKFRYVDMIECEMGAKWKQEKPMVKVYGKIMFNDNNLKSTTNYVTSIFYKNVEDFSFKKDNDSLIFQKICKPTD